MEKKEQKYAVDASAIKELSSFLSDLPYKYKDKIELLAKSFNNSTPIQIAEVKPSAPSDITSEQTA